MSFSAERELLEREVNAHYAQYPTDLSEIERELHAFCAEHRELTPYEQKAHGYGVLAARCPVKVFRHFPFYFEFDTGRPRTSLGEGGIGEWFKREPFGEQLTAEACAWWQFSGESGLCHAWPVLDDNHHSIGNDNVFRGGLNGLIRRAETRLASATDKERDFLLSAVAGLRALITIAGRFADEAERLLEDEKDPAIRKQLRRIAGSARRCPAEPPATFFEALNTLLFMREVTQGLEGNGNSILGHLDRILLPYYERDQAEGRLMREEAKDLLCFALALFDTRFGMREKRNHCGTNTTVMVGGCDATGAPIFNEITRLIAEYYLECDYVDPKLNARVSAQHPREYFDLLAKLTAAGCNSLAIFNDDVIIPANAKMGKAVEDCRLYVGGGCQENLLENTEINSRATIYLNLAHVLLMGFFPERWAAFTEREGIAPATFDGCATFDELYDAFLRNLRAVHDAHVDQRNRTEREGVRYNPCALHSATISDCLEKAKDMMAGGARYSFGSVSLTGIGTVVDSLYAIRQMVYVEKVVTIPDFAAMLERSFQGDEAFRARLLRLPKFGQEDPAIYDFSAKVFADVARVTSGKANTRGGRYEASLFSFRSFTHQGHATGATPDGRRAGEFLSPGMSPSPQALGRECSIGQVLNGLAPVDLTDFPVVAVLDVKLPASPGGYPPEVVTPVIRRFIDCGGSVLQINVVDPNALLDAKAHPERYPDLVVRISGYSAYFTTLPEFVQDEVIARSLATV
ncbi:MAG: pyruvate formate lyase family protein [Armatimonadota bacterium]